MRRLPVYLVLDSSESTLGEAHDSIVLGVAKMLETLRRNPYALETVWLSVITFDAKARVVTPLTDICEFIPPNFKIHPGTALGQAVDLLRERLGREVVRTTADQKGDWKPLVFFLTDGQPTDEWQAAVQRFKASRPRPAHVCAIGVGDDVDFSVLKEIADETYKLDASSEAELPALFNRLFVWLSASVNTTSRALDDNPRMEDALPPGVSLVKDDAPRPCKSPFPKQIFIRRVCSGNGRDFLVRLTFDGQFYNNARVFKVEKDFFSEGSLESPTIPVELMLDDSRCPYCNNFHVFHCSCGAMVCHDGESSLTCPKCGQTASSGVFGVYRGGVRTSEG